MQLNADIASKLARVTFTFCMALAWSGIDRCRAAGAAPAPAAAPVNLAEMADTLHKMAQICIAADRDLPRDTFDPAAVVQKVGKDPEALFAWTRDTTAYVPYRGALRGAIGVLMDRNGNSLDRALLLARLLQLADHKVRLAHGQLDPKQCETLLQKAWDDPKSGPPARIEQSPADDDPELARLASSYGVEPAEVRRGYQDWKTRMQKRDEDVIGTTTEQSRALAQLLGAPAIGADAERARLLADAADHWWVEFSRGSDWVDLDPSTRDAKPGQRQVSPVGTVELPADGQLPNDPALGRHEIELRVRIERSGGGQPVTEVPLAIVIRPAELGGVPIQLQLIPGDWPAELDLNGNPGEVNERFRAALLAQQSWVPVVQIGSQTIMQGGFDAHGVVDPKPRLDAAGKAGGSAKSAGQAVADLFGGGGAPAAPATELTAVWLEYEIRSPGRPARLITREFFDARGPAARMAKAAAMPSFDEARRVQRAAQLYRHFDLMAVGFVPSPEFVQHLSLQNLMSNEPILVKVLKESASKSLKESLRDAASAKPLPAAVLSLAIGRRGPGADGSALAVNRPNLFATSDGLSVRPGGALAVHEDIDIVANEAAVRGMAAPEAFGRRLAQGVRETVLERYAIGHPVESVNTTALFAASDAQKIGWRKLTAPEDPQLSGLGLTPDTLARIKSDLAAGYTVVTPAAPVAVAGHPREGWWRIDPRDGTCVGIGADGAGADMVEEGIASFFIVLEGVLTFNCIVHSSGSGLGCFVCAVARIVIDVITGGNGRLVAFLIGLNSTVAAHICQLGIGE